jgi:4-hydroxyphenylacetate 3-monooxygenase
LTSPHTPPAQGFAEECMAEYDLNVWKVPDLSDPGELSYHVMRKG